MTDKVEFDIDYSAIKVVDEFNSHDFKFPLVLSIPHSGSFLPPDFIKKTAVSEESLHKNEDIYVDELMKKAVDAGICTVKMNVSRVFVDVNRDKIELDSGMFYDYPIHENLIRSKRCRYGIGVIHRVNFQGEEIYGGMLSYPQTMMRIRKVYDVYHKSLQTAINRCIKKFGFCLVLDAHSMPSKICTSVDNAAKIDCCIGDLFEQSCPKAVSDFLVSALEKNGFATTCNVPYSGAFITFNYCQPRKKIFTLQLELNRVLYANEDSLEKSEHFQGISERVCDAVIALAKKMVDFKL